MYTIYIRELYLAEKVYRWLVWTLLYSLKHLKRNKGLERVMINTSNRIFAEIFTLVAVADRLVLREMQNFP